MEKMVDIKKNFYEDKYCKGEEIQRTSKRFTLECIPQAGKLEVLDVGCGSGLNSQYISDLGHCVTGIDISDKAIEKYRKRGFQGEVVDIENGIGFESDTYDLAFCSEVIEHLVSPGFLLQEIYRVLRPGGELVLSVPNSAFWVYRIGAMLGYTVTELQHKMHLRFFTIRSMKAMLENTGFRVVKMYGRNIYFILPGSRFSWASSILKRIGFHEEIRFELKVPFFTFRTNHHL